MECNIKLIESWQNVRRRGLNILSVVGGMIVEFSITWLLRLQSLNGLSAWEWVVAVWKVYTNRMLMSQ